MLIASPHCLRFCKTVFPLNMFYAHLVLFCIVFFIVLICNSKKVNHFLEFQNLFEEHYQDLPLDRRMKDMVEGSGCFYRRDKQ